MFYQAVEEYVMHDRQRELAKELGLRRRLQGSSQSTTVTGTHFLANVAVQLRNLVCRSESAAGS
ncbi:MAG: hypothetical protein ACWGQW_18785, partial [bacterium]